MENVGQIFPSKKWARGARGIKPLPGQRNESHCKQPKEPLGYSWPTAAPCLRTPQGLSTPLPASEAEPGPCPPPSCPGQPRARRRRSKAAGEGQGAQAPGGRWPRQELSVRPLLSPSDWKARCPLTQGEPGHTLRIRPLWENCSRTRQEILHRRCSPGYFNTKLVAGGQSSRSRGLIHDGQ